MTGKIPPIWIPALGALITGGFVGVLAGVLSVAIWHERPWTWGIIAFSASGLLAWWGLLSWWQSLVEGARPAPPDPVYFPSASVRVRFEQNGGNWVDFLEIPLPFDDLRRAADYLVSRDYQTSNLGGKSKPLSRSQAESLRDYMISHDLARWLRPGFPTVGWEFTAAGRAIIRRLASPTRESGVSPNTQKSPPEYKHTQTYKP